MDEDGTERAVCRVRVRGNSGQITEVSIVLEEKKLRPLDGVVFDSHEAYLTKASELYDVKLDVQVAKKVGTKVGQISYVWQFFEKLVIPQIKLDSRKKNIFPVANFKCLLCAADPNRAWEDCLFAVQLKSGSKERSSYQIGNADVHFKAQHQAEYDKSSLLIDKDGSQDGPVCVCWQEADCRCRKRSHRSKDRADAMQACTPAVVLAIGSVG